MLFKDYKSAIIYKQRAWQSSSIKMEVKRVYNGYQTNQLIDKRNVGEQHELFSNIQK